MKASRMNMVRKCFQSPNVWTSRFVEYLESNNKPLHSKLINAIQFVFHSVYLLCVVSLSAFIGYLVIPEKDQRELQMEIGMGYIAVLVSVGTTVIGGILMGLSVVSEIVKMCVDLFQTCISMNKEWNQYVAMEESKVLS